MGARYCWTDPPRQLANKLWIGRRNDQTRFMFYAGSKEKIDTYLDSRCECADEVTTCEFHRMMKGK